MNKLISLAIILALATMMITMTVVTSAQAMKGPDRKAKKQIIRSLSRAVENQWSKYDLVIGSTKNDSSTFTVYNKTSPGQILPVPPEPIRNETNPPIVCIRAPCPGGNETVPPVNETTPPVSNETQPPITNETVPTPPQGNCPTGFHPDEEGLCLPNNPTEQNETGGNVGNESGTTTPPLQCKTDEHEENGVCVKNPVPPIGENGTQPTPTPIPIPSLTKVCTVGDLSGKSVPDAMTKAKCDFKFGLGDLGYQSNLAYFKGLKFTGCVIGNHDSKEDGSSSIEAEALAYCKDHWSKQLGNNTLVIGLNTNGDVNKQIEFYKSTVSTMPNTIKIIIVLSHKNGDVFGSAHHPAESKTLYTAIESVKLPAGVKLIEDSGHNHNIAAKKESDTLEKYISGGGGKSHYSCPSKLPSNGWTLCDASHYGFLVHEINNNGQITSKFLDTSLKTIQ